MGLKEKFDKMIDDATYTEKINSMDSRAHSRAYHRYFAGYTETKIVQEDGKTVIERVYTGTYYKRQLEGKNMLILKLAYLALAIAAAVLFAVNALKRVELNFQWYIALLETMAVVAIFWELIASVNYLISPETMTRYEFKISSCSIKRATAFAAAVLSALCVVSIVFEILTSCASDGEHIAYAARYLVAALCSLTVNILESRLVKYDKFASEMSGKINGVEIQ
jgi:hypothetical protein